MKMTLITATLGLLTVVGIAAAQTPGWGYGPGYGAAFEATGQPAMRPGWGRGGKFCIRGARDPAGRIARKLDRMTAGLGLNEEQKTQVKGILEEQHAKRVTEREATRNRILGVLNEGQRAQAEQFMTRGCQGRGGRFGQGACPHCGWGRAQGTGNTPASGMNPTQPQAPATMN